MNESNVEKNELDFSPIPIGKIPCNQALPSDVYLKINEKFIKFKEADDLIEEEKYNYFISKHLTVLFVKNSEVEKFVEKINEIVQNEIEAKVSEVGEEFRKVVEIQSKVQEKVYEVFLNEELSNEVVTILQNQVAMFVSEIKDKNPSADIFAKISSMNNNIAEHSINVANLALLFGMVTGQSHQAVLENLYMGALFHDYGKAKIPASVLEKPNSVAFERAMASHPEAGVELLKSNPQINKQILSIVLEHHEQFAGVGYPKGKSGDAIYGLSKLVSVANIFDNIAMENKKNKANMYKAAIKVLEYDKGKQFDPSIMPRILDALKLGFGNYVREREIKA